MEIIPVIDIAGGRAVAGRSGEREKYEALKSIYADSSDPVEIARNMPFKRLYAADLDGVMKGKPDLRLLKLLGSIKEVLTDIGIRRYEDYIALRGVGVTPIVATETLADATRLKEMLDRGAIVSIDVKWGKVLSPFLSGDIKEAFEFFRREGASKFIFLDISAVGTMAGNRFDFLRRLELVGIEVMVGGGITQGDLDHLKNLGVSGALVGTALHRGFLTP